MSDKNTAIHMIATNNDALPIILDEYDSFLYDVLCDSPFGKEYIVEVLNNYPKIYEKQINYLKNNIFKDNDRNITMNILKFLSKKNIDISDYIKETLDRYLLENPNMFFDLAAKYNYTEYALNKILNECEKNKSVVNYMLILKLNHILPFDKLEKILNVYLNSSDDINAFEINRLYIEFKGNKKLFDILIGKYLSNKDIKSIIALIKDSKEENIPVEKYIDKKLFKKIINDNIRSDYIFDLGNVLSDIMHDEVNEVFTKREDYLLNKLAKLLISTPVSAPKDSKELVVMILKELLDNQEIDLQDIKIYEAGGYSNVLGIGEIILKLSKPKETYEIPNSKYILQPIMRKQFDEYKGLIIEIDPLVETENITTEEVEQLYYNLRKEGLIWTDIKVENVGRLIKPNKAVYKMRTGELQPNSSSTGMLGDVDTLSAGNVVLIDSDFIYKKVTRKTQIPDYSLYDEFENNYISSKTK